MPVVAEDAYKTTCPICMEPYSDLRPPLVAPRCAHSICEPCAKKRLNATCVSCNVRNVGGDYGGAVSCERWKKNFALIEAINNAAAQKKSLEKQLETERKEKERTARQLTFKTREMEAVRTRTMQERAQEQQRITREVEMERARVKEEIAREKERAARELEAERARWREDRAREQEKRAREQKERRKLEDLVKQLTGKLPNTIDHHGCARCGVEESRARMMVCGECASKGDVECTLAEESKILPFIFCPFCRQEGHKDHQVMKYLEWKFPRVFNPSVDGNQSTVDSQEELCKREFDSGNEKLKEWKETLDSFRVMHCVDYRSSLAVVDSLKKEATLVHAVSDEAMPALRKRTLVLTESNTRLLKLKEDVEKEMVERAVGNDPMVAAVDKVVVATVNVAMVGVKNVGERTQIDTGAETQTDERAQQLERVESVSASQTVDVEDEGSVPAKKMRIHNPHIIDFLSRLIDHA